MWNNWKMKYAMFIHNDDAKCLCEATFVLLPPILQGDYA
jgi:hypothetical protein